LQTSPQTLETSPTQALSHDVSQQNESTVQISATQASQPSSRAAPVMHLSWVQFPQTPQSWGHVEQLSSKSHDESPQPPSQEPQSPGHVVHVSPAPQMKSPQQPPQSPGQLLHVSPASQ
jgi:hypothetical protein